jgi:hypothetical protein
VALQQRILILFGAVLAFAIVCRRIQKDKILVEDSIYWVVLSLLLVVVAAFPDIAIWMAGLLGFISPINFVYLLIIALLLIKVFSNSAEISMLKSKVNDLAQEIALREELGTKDAHRHEDSSATDTHH